MSSGVFSADKAHMKFRMFAAVLAAGLFLPAPASAQGMSSRPAMGENYYLELAATWWKPKVKGSITSDSLELVGSRIDLVDDLGFTETPRFRDIRITLRPARKHKLRFQHTPLEYNAEATLTRDISFAGEVFPVSLPVASDLTWKVWRFGYEWDVVSRSRGFVGVLFELRRTELSAALTSLVASGSVVAEAPLPSIGVVSRIYPLPDLALNFEFSGFKVPEMDGDYEGTYSDLEVSATVNISNNLGVSAGWRRLNTDIRIERDFGDLKFSGVWFGGAVRF